MSQKGTKNSYSIGEILEGWRKSSNPLLKFVDEDISVYEEEFNTVSEAMKFRDRKSEKVLITEDTQKQLLKRAEAKRKVRAKTIKTYYSGVANTKGWITYHTPSQTRRGVKYVQYIKLKEAKDAKYFKEFKEQDIIRLLLLSGDLQVYCSCPDFKYRGYKYMGYTQGYGMFRELRYPKVRNPKLEGSICKHLIAVLNNVGFNWNVIAKEMRKTKYWKTRMRDNYKPRGSEKK